MSMLKIGASYYNGKATPVYLIYGYATRDAETKDAGGKELASVSIAADEGENGDRTYVTLKGWRNNAPLVRGIKKADCVLAIGRLTSNSYNDRVYLDLDVDFVAKNGAGIAANYGRTAPADKTAANVRTAEQFAKYYEERERPPEGNFAEITADDDGLPF